MLAHALSSVYLLFPGPTQNLPPVSPPSPHSEIAAIIPAGQASIDPCQWDVLQECRTVSPVIRCLKPLQQYVSDSLTGGLPGLLSARRQAERGGVSCRWTNCRLVSPDSPLRAASSLARMGTGFDNETSHCQRGKSAGEAFRSTRRASPLLWPNRNFGRCGCRALPGWRQESSLRPGSRRIVRRRRGCLICRRFNRDGWSQPDKRGDRMSRFFILTLRSERADGCDKA
jgi:hypothetical protein